MPYSKSKATTIYALSEPTGAIRYIGKTLNLKRRFNRHLNDARNGARPWVYNWLRNLLKQGFKPVVIVLEECNGDGYEEEKYHIKLARKDGLKLTNISEGGEGVTGGMMSIIKRLAYADPEWRRRQSLRMIGVRKGWHHAPEIKKKLSLAHKKSPLAIAARIKVSAIRVRQMSAAIRGTRRPREEVERKKHSRWNKIGGFESLMQFSHELDQYLSRNGITHACFAKSVGVQQSCISRIRAGKRFPSGELLNKMKFTMNTPSHLFQRSHESHPSIHKIELHSTHPVLVA